MQWHKIFNERQLKEIEFARIYNNIAEQHDARTIISQFAELLDKIESMSEAEDFTKMLFIEMMSSD